MLSVTIVLLRAVYTLFKRLLGCFQQTPNIYIQLLKLKCENSKIVQRPQKMCKRGLFFSTRGLENVQKRPWKTCNFRSKIRQNFRQNLCQNFRKKGFEKPCKRGREKNENSFKKRAFKGVQSPYKIDDRKSSKFSLKFSSKRL